MTQWRRLSGKYKNPLMCFLRKHELNCVAAVSKFLRAPASQSRAWVMPNHAGEIDAFLFSRHNSFYPVLDGQTNVSLPKYLKYFLALNPPHAIQGLKEDALVLERIFAGLGYFLKEEIDYDLMILKEAPGTEALLKGPGGLVIRNPEPKDRNAVHELQAAYEKEEVIPKGAAFNPQACRLATEIMMKKEQLLLAELGGRVVGKINTNARSFSCCQIGGVYVLPQYRRMGIATRMSAVFSQKLMDQGLQLTLFVKKRNHSARSAYENAGFKVFNDYRIAYY